MTETELRRSFHDRLAGLRDVVDRMGATVLEMVGAVSAGLLGDDPSTSRSARRLDRVVDASYQFVESEVFELVALQAPVARDLRFLIAALRIAQEIERSGDLIANIGRRAPVLGSGSVADPIWSALGELATHTERLLADALAAYRVLDEAVAEQVIAGDDLVDRCHRKVVALVYESRLDARIAVEVTMIARFYERIGDHAVVIAERIRFVCSGEMDPGDHDTSV